MMREISIIYHDGMMDMVEPKILQRLIDSDQIIKFQRFDGWVYPEIDSIRRSESTAYQGQERRFI